MKSGERRQLHSSCDGRQRSQRTNSLASILSGTTRPGPRRCIMLASCAEEIPGGASLMLSAKQSRLIMPRHRSWVPPAQTTLRRCGRPPRQRTRPVGRGGSAQACPQAHAGHTQVHALACVLLICLKSSKKTSLWFSDAACTPPPTRPPTRPPTHVPARAWHRWRAHHDETDDGSSLSGSYTY